MDFVATDLGASCSRYCTADGKIFELPNNMVVLSEEEVVRMREYDSEIESNLEVIISKNGHSKYFPKRVLIGAIAERYSPVQTRPNSMTHKHMQDINYISAITEVALAKLKKNLSNDILLVMDTPPVETNNAQNAFNNELCGEYTVSFPRYNGGVEVNFKIVHVECYEESVMALASYFFNENGLIIEEHKKCLGETILSIDIGSSTSDLSLSIKGKYLDNTGRTYKKGGNLVRTRFIDLVRSMYGYDLPVEEAEQAIKEGRLKNGSDYVDVSKLVTESKMFLARQLIEDIPSYFQSINKPLQVINGVVVSGGGSLSGYYMDNGKKVVTSESMSTFVTNELKKICEGIDVIHYGDDARSANIKGLLIASKILIKKYAENKVTTA